MSGRGGASRDLALTLYDLAYLRPGPAADDAAAMLYRLVMYRLTGEEVEAPVEDYRRLTIAAAQASGTLARSCIACGAGRPFRRELCRTCHRKLNGTVGASGYDGRTADVTLRGIVDTARRLDAVKEGERIPRQLAARLRAYPPERTLLLFALDLDGADTPAGDAGDARTSGDNDLPAGETDETGDAGDTCGDLAPETAETTARAG